MSQILVLCLEVPYLQFLSFNLGCSAAIYELPRHQSHQKQV